MKSIALCERNLVENKEIKTDRSALKVEEKLINDDSSNKKLPHRNGVKESEDSPKNDANPNVVKELSLKYDGSLVEEPEINTTTIAKAVENIGEEEHVDERTNGSSSGDSLTIDETYCSEVSELLEREISGDLDTHSRNNEELKKGNKISSKREEEYKILVEDCILEESHEMVDNSKVQEEIQAGEVNLEAEVEDIIIDDDENKENEKDHKGDCSEAEMNLSSKCVIQVGECQTVDESYKKSIWLNKSEDMTSVSEVRKNSVLKEDTEKDDDVQEVFEEPENAEINCGQNSEISCEEDAIHMDVEECCLNNIIEDSEAENSISDSRSETASSRKRQITDEVEEAESIARKKKCSKSGMDGEKPEDSSPIKNSTLKKVVDVSNVKARNVEMENVSKELESADAENKPESVGECSKSSTEKAPFTSSFLSSLRGTLKSLTRSDLEELVVQKLCEAISERSNVGELRRKTQVLEQEQERWKSKVISLTKLVREMDMVMKKYITEVQKQKKPGDTSIVMPLKVTRSVGLQVSFLSNVNKGPVPTSAQLATSNTVPNTTGKIAKPNHSKLPQTQMITFSKSVCNKTLNQKYSPLQKSPVSQQQQQPQQPKQQQQPPQQQQQKRQIASRSDYSSPAQNQNPVITNSSQTQGTRPSSRASPVAATSQQHQQQQQNGSKVIDLTEDDDRQIGNQVGAKTLGQIRVASNVPQNNRFTYIIPVSNTSTPTSSSTQSRQVLIATPTMPPPNRHMMCSMPPLFFKGGNAVQASGGQPQVVNQPGPRAPYPKTLKHPAPLPVAPVNTPNNPNLKLKPPRPALKISKVQTGIVLSWNMSLGPVHAPISSYQLYAYQETNSPPSTSLWKKVGDVKALPLPMACTLTQFMSGHKYHFAVRAVDIHSRVGPFSFPGTIVLVK